MNREAVFPTLTRQRIVICGSMSAYSHMLEAQEKLASEDLAAVIPDTDDIGLTLSVQQACAVRRDAGLRHMRRIRDSRTAGVLLMNVDRYGIHDYVGPNTFAEAAVAFMCGRPIYLWQRVPASYEDEFETWGATALDCDLTPLIDTMRHRSLSQQLRLPI